MEITVWFYFAIACFGLALTPGPNAMLVMTHSVRFGPAVAFYTVTGGVLSFIGLMVISLFGIDALLKAYPAALSYIKLGGGLYLIGLGIRQWMLRKIDINQPVASISGGTKLTLFAQGAISAASNPKVFLFFAAFLTQFINPHQDLLSQFIVMVITFALAEFIVEMAINLTAGRFRASLAKHGQYFCFFCGALFIIIGVIVLLTGLL
ncbi:LysE family translocator [Klebsiella sp. BIGb0407]|uniref:LysE family translocator n=1 Tax=Klebsiella sp. BIGb0407 TaxID=2940603 RepID=UPI002166F661|nr:LysE family translocator [Klebsiella sp. BIGb0407]MCS3431481.1 threonine/homoserine/homoserine lactone efflux protein [Klebsiella sp. BIGb0407]